MGGAVRERKGEREGWGGRGRGEVRGEGEEDIESKEGSNRYVCR